MDHFKSGVIFQDKIILCENGHENNADLIESLTIDNAQEILVQACLLPGKLANRPYFEKPISEWQFKVDQDTVPDWFSKDPGKYELLFREAVTDWMKEHYLSGKEIKTLSEGYFILKDCNVILLCGNVIVDVCGYSMIKGMYDKSIVNNIYDTSEIKAMFNHSKIINMWDNSLTENMQNHTSILNMFNDSNVGIMKDNSTIVSMHDESYIETMQNNSSVQNMENTSDVGMMWDNALVKKIIIQRN